METEGGLGSTMLSFLDCYSPWTKETTVVL